MWARVSRFRGPPDRIDDDIAQTRQAAEAVAAIPGSRGIYYMVNRESGQTMAVTLWEDEESLRASEEQANKIRQESADQAGQEIAGVERYEVAYQPESAL